MENLVFWVGIRHFNIELVLLILLRVYRGVFQFQTHRNEHVTVIKAKCCKRICPKSMENTSSKSKTSPKFFTAKPLLILADIGIDFGGAARACVPLLIEKCICFHQLLPVWFGALLSGLYREWRYINLEIRYDTTLCPSNILVIPPYF